MELLSLLKPRQLGFIYDEQHKFKPDNPEVKCVFVPPTVQYNPPILCQFALITRPTGNVKEWNPDTYSLVGKLSANKQIHSLYAHNTEKLTVNIVQLIYSVLSPINRAFVIGPMTEKPTDQTFHQFILIGTNVPSEADYFQTTNSFDKYQSKNAYSILVIPPNKSPKDFVKDVSHFEIIIDYNPDNQYQKYYTYQFEGVKVFTNKPLFALLDRYKEIQNLKIKVISLRDRPSRRKNFIAQLESQQLNYEVFYGFDGQCCNVETTHPSDVSIKPGKTLYTIYCGNETYVYDPTIRLNGKLLTYGEIGCSVAHLRAYESIKDDDKFTLIFEDDANMDNFERFFYTMRQLPPADSFDIVYLHNEATWWPPIMETAINDCYYQTKKGTSTNLCLALLLTSNAKRMINYYHQLVMQQCLSLPLSSKYKFICLISDDLISHSARANLLRGIAPFIRNISTQHLPSHINIVTEESKAEKRFLYDKQKHFFTDVLLKDCNDLWTGLGNQMFQYASAKLFSLLTKKELVGQKEGCKLFVAFENIEIGDIKQGKTYLEIKENINHKLIDAVAKPDFEAIKDKNLSLSGFFQHSDYFKGNEYIVREMFKFKKDIDLIATQNIQTIRNLYPNKKLVAVHIRRRDFKGETCEFLYDLYTPSSLKPKLDKFESMMKDPFVYVIFSNDIKETEGLFAQDFIKRGANFLLIETPPLQLGPHKNGCLDLCMMKECDHFIISASSYSWWGAFLAKNNDKIVIMPKVWYNPKRADVNGLDTSVIGCENWNQV